MITFMEATLFLLILFLIGSIYWYATIPKNLPPGPPALPFLGNTLDYRKGADQHLVVLQHIKKYGPVFRLWMGNKLIIILGDYDSIQEGLVKQSEIFAGRPQIFALLPEKLHHYGVISSEGDLWKEHRRFALSTLRDFGFGRPILEPHIKEEIEYLTERFGEYSSKGTAFNPQPLLMCAVSNVISQMIFGRRFSYDDKEFLYQFTALSKRVAGSNVGFLSPFLFSQKLAVLARVLPLVRRFKKEIMEFLDFTEREISETIKSFDPESEPSNYIHAYLKAARGVQGQSFTDPQLLSTVLDLFIAGTETTSTTLRYALLLMASHPEVQEKMCKEIREQIGTSLPNYADKVKLPFCEAVISEVQRFANLTPFGVARRTLQPTTLMGYDIPEDTVIMPFLTNVLWNPDLVSDPNKFDPYRFFDSNDKVIRDPKMIPFQAGKRICLGESLARMELFLVLIGLISRFRFYFPAGQPKPTLEPVVGVLSAPVAYQFYVESRGD